MQSPGAALFVQFFVCALLTSWAMAMILEPRRTDGDRSRVRLWHPVWLGFAGATSYATAKAGEEAGARMGDRVGVQPRLVHHRGGHSFRLALRRPEATRWARGSREKLERVAKCETEFCLSVTSVFYRMFDPPSRPRPESLDVPIEFRAARRLARVLRGYVRSRCLLV